jgi:formylglycine-generating enzyme required for sulfatase activity
MTEEQVFLAALDRKDPADRAAFLEEACGADVDLRRQVEELLALHVKPGEFLDEPMGAPAGSGGAEPESDDLKFLLPATRPDSLGRIGDYHVLEVLGRGGFGIVFRAFDDALQQVVAVKVLAPAVAATSPARKRFLREGRSSARVRHENVVHVHAVVEHPLPHLVMDFVPGESLQQRLDRTGPLDVPDVVRLGRQIAEGLAAAHATGLIHRDIKPANILLEAGPVERVKITDFGLARAADDASLTQSGVLAGTPMYMAPEQGKGEPLDHRADLFSLDSVMYVMTTGRPPFRAGTTFGVLKRVVEESPRPIRDVIPEVPPWLCEIVARLHAKKPDDRFQTARDVADVLADCEAKLRANAGPEEYVRVFPGQSAARRHGRRKRFAVAAVVLPVFTLATAEIAGVTRWFHERPSTVDAAAKGGGDGTRPEGSGAPAEFTNSLGMKFMRIPAGKFVMGSPADEVDRLVGTVEDDGYKRMLRTELPEHEVEIARPFFMGATEVTVGQFRRFVEANPDYKVGDERWKSPGFEQTEDHPVVWVSWQNAVDFCTWLSKTEGKTYRLPTEAEWEYCCRAGKSRARYCYGDESARLEYYAWYNTVSGKGTHPVGLKKPNDWGLYDMHGNAWEWCRDGFDPNYYQDSPVKDPQGPDFRDMSVQRGGSWDFGPMVCRSAFRSFGPRSGITKDRGFRVLLVAPLGGEK